MTKRIEHILWTEGTLDFVEEERRVHLVIFVGPEAKKRAREYETWLKEKEHG